MKLIRRNKLRISIRYVPEVLGRGVLKPSMLNPELLKPERWAKAVTLQNGQFDNLYSRLLIIGGTGALGRQVVIQALKKGYQVNCLVRNFKKARFLRRWGARVLYGDLRWPHTFPRMLKGITAIIDASTNRATEAELVSIIDYEAKLIFVELAQTSDIQRFIFFSVKKYKRFLPFARSRGIPLLNVKAQLENDIKDSRIPYTIFRITGFYQGLIEQYAIPILENLPIWVTNENTNIAYMDTQDIARFCLRSFQIPQTKNQTFFLSGLRGWVSSEIINLCEQLAGQKSKVQRVPLFALKLVTSFFGFFEWGQNISARLAFVEILNTENNFSKSTFELYKMFKNDPSEIIQLDDYFLEYFIRLLKRLRDINFEDVQKQKNLII